MRVSLLQTSYLDDVVTLNAPTREPGTDSVAEQNGVLVDEFGLPKISQTVKCGLIKDQN
jgi:hypothetical protein